MRKREKPLTLSKETLMHLETPVEDLAAAVGGSCRPIGGSTAGGTKRICCDEVN
ncbi:MAG TPA: hypothetical protein VN783_13985 [Thermoanaerobaculia bacterium]|nr:hypothetical protein [Thermoanaerobaculia bacterium]